MRQRIFLIKMIYQILSKSQQIIKLITARISIQKFYID